MRILAVASIALAVVAVVAFEKDAIFFIDGLHPSRFDYVPRQDANQDLQGTRRNRQKDFTYNHHASNIIDFKSYPRYRKIRAYLRAIARKYAFVKYEVLGYSFENREIMGLKFSSGARGKPAVFIDAGFHAREWPAPTTALYAIKQLAENASNYHLFRNVDIYVVPLVNPDGYEYTHSDETARYWRKNRAVFNFTKCVGVDLNRNFEPKWRSVGASRNPCDDNYAGGRAFSEPESRAIRDFVWDRRDRIKVYLTLHSFGQFFLHPWGFLSDEMPKSLPILRCTASAAVKELKKVRGVVYEVGSSSKLLRPAAGGSDDWAMSVAGIPVSFTIELPPPWIHKIVDNFQPPVSQIEPTGRETFEAIKVFIRYVKGEICAEPPAVVH